MYTESLSIDSCNEVVDEMEKILGFVDSGVLVDGKYSLKDGWVLFLNDRSGIHKIEKMGIHTIFAKRVVGGQWGDGYWTITYTTSLEDYWHHTTLYNIESLSIDSCNKVVDEIESIMKEHRMSGRKRRSFLSRLFGVGV